MNLEGERVALLLWQVNKDNAVEKLQMVRGDMWRTDPSEQP